MGIWALVVMRKEQVKAAFGQEHIDVAVPPKVHDFAVWAAADVKEVFSRGKAEVEKIIGQKAEPARPSADGDAKQKTDGRDTGTPGRTRGLAVGSFVLGLVSILLASHAHGFIDKFVFSFLPAFFAAFLGVMAVKRIRFYRDHPLDTGLAVLGILAALITALTIFGSLTF
jgi:hypothetical protein